MISCEFRYTQVVSILLLYKFNVTSLIEWLKLTIDFDLFRLQEATKNGSKSYDEVFIKKQLGLIDMKKLLPSL